MARPKANNVILDYIISEGSSICDIPRGLSLLNRKSYRSGYVYSVDFVEYIGGGPDVVRTACLPFSYPLFQAWKMGFAAWREQRSSALENADYLEPGKWADFKAFYSQLHLVGPGAGGFTELTPAGVQGANLTMVDLDTTGSEWNRSILEYNDPGAATVSPLYIGMLADDDLPGGYGSLMHAYGVLRSPTLAPDPIVPIFASGSWMTKTGEESSDMAEAVINIIEDDNDNPPYANQADYLLSPTYVGGDQSAPGGILMDIGTTGSTGRAISLDGGLIPLGLLVVHVAMNNPELKGTLRIHCTRGEYKGSVAALPMGDFS